MNLKFLKPVFCGFAAAICLAQSANADPRGVWITEGGESRVEIKPCGDRLCGTIVWMQEPKNDDGSLKLDKENQNASLRDRPILGLDLLSDFIDKGGGKWAEGKIYNPKDGATYRSELEVIDASTLKVSGCVFIFCQEQTWIRHK